MLRPTAGDAITPQEIGFVATPDRLITVRKTTRTGADLDVAALHTAADAGVPVGVLVYRLVDDVTDTYLDLLDSTYADIDELEDRIDELQPAQVRLRLAELRHQLL